MGRGLGHCLLRAGLHCGVGLYFHFQPLLFFAQPSLLCAAGFFHAHSLHTFLALFSAGLVQFFVHRRKGSGLLWTEELGLKEPRITGRGVAVCQAGEEELRTGQGRQAGSSCECTACPGEGRQGPRRLSGCQQHRGWCSLPWGEPRSHALFIVVPTPWGWWIGPETSRNI